MGVERRAPPNPLRVSSETADGRGSILIDTTAAQQTITAPAQTPGLLCNKTSPFSFLFHLHFSFSNFYIACYLYGSPRCVGAGFAGCQKQLQERRGGSRT